MTERSIKKILIANRGEIAERVIRTCKKLGIKSVAVYSDIEADALHVRLADESVCLGPAPSAESYLRADKILAACKELGVDAIHPGYGFLSENAEFAKQCTEAGVIFIGPEPDSIVKMGDKTRARHTMIDANVPVVPGTKDPIVDVDAALERAKEIGFPIMLKAAAGGGGKGMRLVEDPNNFKKSFEAAAREALNAFGDDRVYMEKYVVSPRHVEVQIFGDTHGNVIHLFERECSIQRRHQKVIEESPSPFITDDTRSKITQAAVDAGKAVNYIGAGTCEFLVDVDQNFYFLEMNTRLQVEHPVTEFVTGQDLVELQIAVAEGKELPIKQEDVTQTGWSMEARVYAENPWDKFLPSPGRIERMVLPQGDDVRLDIGVYEGYNIPLEYDPMIGKLVVYGKDRAEATEKLEKALDEFRILGVHTNLPFHRVLLGLDKFKAGDFDTGWLDRVDLMEGVELSDENREIAKAVAAVLAYQAEVDARAQRESLPRSGWQRAVEG